MHEEIIIFNNGNEKSVFHTCGSVRGLRGAAPHTTGDSISHPGWPHHRPGSAYPAVVPTVVSS